MEAARGSSPNEDDLYVLDSKSGATLVTIPMTVAPTALVFDPAGQYAYVSGSGAEGPDGYLLKISVASRKIVNAVRYGRFGYAHAGCAAFSADGSKLFLAFSGPEPHILRAVDPDSLETLAYVPFAFPAILNSIQVSGNLLLVSVTSPDELLYLDAGSLQLTNSVALDDDYLIIFGVDAIAGRIYLWSACCSQGLIEVRDLASGELLISRRCRRPDHCSTPFCRATEIRL